MSSQAPTPLPPHTPVQQNSEPLASIGGKGDCPVAPLAVQALDLAKSYVELENRIGPDGDASAAGGSVVRSFLRKNLRAISEMQGAVENRASYAAAKSALGALFQLALIRMEAERLEGWAELGPETRGAAELMDRIDRMVWSVGGFIETLTGVTFSDAHGDWYMVEDNNPHGPFLDVSKLRVAMSAAGH